MIDQFQAWILALVQGLTEFLPVSSSGHLLIPTQVFGWPDQGLDFDIAVHFGTLMAVIAYYRKDLLMMAQGTIEGIKLRQMNPELDRALLLGLATLPAVVVGLISKDWIEVNLRSAWVIAAATVGFGLLLGFADKKARQDKTDQNWDWRDSLLVGLAQILAFIPGTSRSGITITMALLLGYKRSAAANFSFLMSIPLILAASLLMLLDVSQSTQPVDVALIIQATLISAISAYLCIAAFIKLVDRIGMMPFVIYRLLLGGFLAWWLWTAG